MISNELLKPILTHLLAGKTLTHAHHQCLEEYSKINWSGLCGMNNPTAISIQKRAAAFPLVYGQVKHYWEDVLNISSPCLLLLWEVWLPLALFLIERHHSLHRPLIQGIVGSQGAGKTTLTHLLQLILTTLGYPTLSLSLDDFYKTYADREALRQTDPRLIWRGPPGTHDVELALQVCSQLRQPLSQPVAIPRFDKTAWGGAGDRSHWEFVQDVGIILFEGWFVGVRPIDPGQFETAPPPILTAADRAFAQATNDRLQQYQPLWQCLDGLIVLDLVDYRLSQQWRWQAEARAIESGRSGMSEREVHQFVKYFWRALHPQLFIPPLTQDAGVDLVIEIGFNQLPQRVYCPDGVAAPVPPRS